MRRVAFFAKYLRKSKNICNFAVAKFEEQLKLTYHEKIFIVD